MYSRLPVIIAVEISFRNTIYVKDYTAKLVKSMLISGNPRLGEIFSKGKDMPPKPIHITPLYTFDTTKRPCKKAVYTKFIPKSSTAKHPNINELKPVKIEAGRKYFFHIGTSMNMLNDMLAGLSNFRFSFGRETVDVESLSYEIHYVDVMRESERISEMLEVQGNKGERAVRVTFESPTLLKDPLVVMRRKKKKLLLPLPEAVLATPLFMILADMGKLRRSIFLRCMRYIKSVFDTPYSALKTVNLVWYVYDSNVLPAMIGYVKYFIDFQVLARAQTIMKMKYGIDFVNLLSKTIVLAQIYGVGDGRATGFGHVSIQLQR